MIFVMNLDGNVMKRLGRARDGSGHGEFEEPTDIAINHEHVFVLDARGARVHVIDHDANSMRSFPIPHGTDPNMNRENGLGIDRNGNVYVSSFHTSMVRVFRHDGQLLSVFGRPGHSAGEFVCPVGLWVDSANRLYVADSGNGRVQLFQLKATERDSSAEKAAEAPPKPHSASSEDKSTLMKQ
jgi:DNA-binding beta-propeller fold protein YncE